MTTKRKSTLIRQLEKIAGGPLTLGGLIEAIREGENWSLADMAKRLKVTKAHVAAIEKGKPVSPESAAKYAKVLGYSPEQFVRLALQDSMKRAHLPYVIELKRAA